MLRVLITHQDFITQLVTYGTCLIMLLAISGAFMSMLWELVHELRQYSALKTMITKRLVIASIFSALFMLGSICIVIKIFNLISQYKL